MVPALPRQPCSNQSPALNGPRVNNHSGSPPVSMNSGDAIDSSSVPAPRRSSPSITGVTARNGTETRHSVLLLETNAVMSIDDTLSWRRPGLAFATSPPCLPVSARVAADSGARLELGPGTLQTGPLPP